MNRLIKIFVIAILFVFTTCKKEKAFPSWDTDVLSPLLKSTLTLKDLLTDSLLKENPDSSLKLIYHSGFYSLVIDSLLTIPDTSLKYVYPPFPISYYHLDSNEIVMSNIGTTNFNMGNVLLSYAKIRNGYIKVETWNTLKQKINVRYSIASAKLNGVPFAVSEQVPAATTAGSVYFTKLYSLAGYDIDFRGAAGDKFNTVSISVIANIDDSVTMHLGDSVVFKNTYFNISPSYAKGYFGKDTVTIGPAENHLGLFDNVKAGSLLLDDATVKLHIDNYTGIDSRVQINSWYSLNSFSGNSVQLASDIIGSPININRAIETGDPQNPVIPSSWSTTLNNSNSNIKGLLENLPNALGYSLRIQTNPLGNISGSNDFIFSDRTINASVDIEVPLSLSAAGLTLQDTVDFSLQTGTQADNVNNGVLTLFANNGFPFNATIQMYMLHANGQITDSLFTENKTIASGMVDANFKVIAKKISKLPVPLSKSKLDLLKNTHRMVVKIKYDTYSSPQLVKLYSHYGIDVRLVGDFNFTVNFDN